MKHVYRVKMLSGEWIADFSCLETAQKFVGSDEFLTITHVFKVLKREH